MHRDLKLDNLLLANKDDISALKIADFGIARKEGSVSGLSQLKTVCGTTRELCCALASSQDCPTCRPCQRVNRLKDSAAGLQSDEAFAELPVLHPPVAEYIAPEVIAAGRKKRPDGTVVRNVYGPECDLWSAGERRECAAPAWRQSVGGMPCCWAAGVRRPTLRPCLALTACRRHPVHAAERAAAVLGRQPAAHAAQHRRRQVLVLGPRVEGRQPSGQGSHLPPAGGQPCQAPDLRTGIIEDASLVS